MKLIILAFILSLSLHFLIFSPYNKNQEIKDKPSTSKEVKKSSVKYVKILKKEFPKQLAKEKIEKKQEIKKTKPKTYTKVDKEKIVPQKKVRLVKESKRAVPKPVKKREVKPSYKKVEIKPQEKRKTIQKKSLENFLLTEPTPLDMDMLDNITRNYLKLYGEEYNSMTKVQKVYLQKNLKNFTRITQRVLDRLGYPPLAARLNLSGYNIVEFIFHPDGSISDLKLSYKSEHNVFNKYTLELIEFAHKDYPRPKEPTKIKFNVIYKVY